jgi:hypothetical protein
VRIDFLGLVGFCCLDFLDVGGGGVAIIRLTASSNLTPWILKSMALGMDELSHRTKINASQSRRG